MQLVQEIQSVTVDANQREKYMDLTAEDYTMIRLDQVKDCTEYRQYSQTTCVDYCGNGRKDC